MKVSPGAKFMVTSTAALLLVGFSAALFWRLSGSVKSGVETLQDIGARIAALEEDRKAARIFESLREGRKEDFERINRFLPQSESPVELIEGLEALARGTKNSIVLDADENRSKAIGELVFRLTVEGSEESVRKYLAALELIPYGLRVEDIVLQQIDIGNLLPPELSGHGGAIRPTHRMLLTVLVKTS